MAKRTLTPDAPCRMNGCSTPRMLDKHGNQLSFCPVHQRQYWARQNRKHDERRRTGEPGRPRRKPIKLLLVDNTTGNVLRVSGFVDQEVPMSELKDGGQLHPLTEAVYERKGYVTGTRGVFKEGR